MAYKNDEKMEKTSHISYKEYKQKLESKPNEGLILFVSAFFVMLLLFLGVVKQLSPDVDVSIGDNSETTVEEFEKGSVDERLRAIQMEDNSSMMSSDETFSPELDEKVRLPKQTRKVIGEPELEEVVTLQNEDHVTKTDKTVESETAPLPSTTNAKVIVGYYATSAQAEVAKSIIMDSGLNIQPFVKNIGGAYTLQVGSFSSREKAQNVANDLLKNNFPARVIVE
ncbi:SPOR domain-containing protein [bacterium]|nr:SPOR domain-containing protein [bacterium]